MSSTLRPEIEPVGALSTASIDALYRKVTLRFIPLLFIGYIFNYMDRTNIGYAQLQMKGDLGISDVAYGVGAGIFFVSYSVFGLPSNLIMSRIGARLTILICLVGWGLTSASTMLVRTQYEFYALRLLLGVVEAGFLPGILFYFSQWFPSHRRARVNGLFLSATVMAGVISGVLSGALMTYMDGHFGLRGWQWMFLIEGLPSVVLGICIYFILEDEPERAKWLTAAEKATLLDALKNDPAVTSGHRTVMQAFGDWKTYLLGLIYFLVVIDTYVLAFWQPLMIRELGVSSIMKIGLFSAIPPTAAFLAKILVGHSSDRKKELRWHFAIPAFAGAAGMSLVTLFPHSPLLGIACLTLAQAGVHGSIPIFWSATGRYLSGTAAAAGIALITTIGGLAGAAGPPVLGFIKEKTGEFVYGMYMMSALLVAGAVLLLLLLSMAPGGRQNPAADGASK